MTTLRRLLCRWFGRNCSFGERLTISELRGEMRQRGRKAEAQTVAFRRMRVEQQDFAHRLLLGDDK